MTIVAIFAPASFMSGIAGQFFKQFGITVSALVLFSLLAARLVTPMLAAYFLKAHHQPGKPPGGCCSIYVRLVTWSVRHYFVTVFVGFLLFAASIWSVGLLSRASCRHKIPLDRFSPSNFRPARNCLIQKE